MKMSLAVDNAEFNSGYYLYTPFFTFGSCALYTFHRVVVSNCNSTYI